MQLSSEILQPSIVCWNLPQKIQNFFSKEQSRDRTTAKAPFPKVLKPNGSEMTGKQHSQVSNVQSRARQGGPDRQTSHRNALYPLEGFTASPDCLRAPQETSAPLCPCGAAGHTRTHHLLPLLVEVAAPEKSSNNPIPCKNHMQLSRTLSKTTFLFCFFFFPQPCLLL